MFKCKLAIEPTQVVLHRCDSGGLVITYFDMTDTYKSPTVHAVASKDSILVSCSKEFLADDWNAMVEHYGLTDKAVDWDYWEDEAFANYRIYLPGENDDV